MEMGDVLKELRLLDAELHEALEAADLPAGEGVVRRLEVLTYEFEEAGSELPLPHPESLHEARSHCTTAHLVLARARGPRRRLECLGNFGQETEQAMRALRFAVGST